MVPTVEFPPGTPSTVQVTLPLALNNWVSPNVTTTALGVIKNPAVTASDPDPEMEPDVAVMIVEPGATPVAIPEGSTVETYGVDELQVTVAVKSGVVPSL